MTTIRSTLAAASLAPSILVLDRADYDFLGPAGVIQLMKTEHVSAYVVWGTNCLDLNTVPVEPHVHAVVDATYPATPETYLNAWRKLYDWLSIPWLNFTKPSAAYAALKTFGVLIGSDVCKASSSGMIQVVRSTAAA